MGLAPHHRVLGVDLAGQLEGLGVQPGPQECPGGLDAEGVGVGVVGAAGRQRQVAGPFHGVGRRLGGLQCRAHRAVVGARRREVTGDLSRVVHELGQLEVVAAGLRFGEQVGDEVAEQAVAHHELVAGAHDELGGLQCRHALADDIGGDGSADEGDAGQRGPGPGPEGVDAGPDRPDEGGLALRAAGELAEHQGVALGAGQHGPDLGSGEPRVQGAHQLRGRRLGQGADLDLTAAQQLDDRGHLLAPWVLGPGRGHHVESLDQARQQRHGVGVRPLQVVQHEHALTDRLDHPRGGGGRVRLGEVDADGPTQWQVRRPRQRGEGATLGPSPPGGGGGGPREGRLADAGRAHHHDEAVPFDAVDHLPELGRAAHQPANVTRNGPAHGGGA